nr:heavy metal-associated isoprenylated plant protein 32-like [Ipomoea trifida]
MDMDMDANSREEGNDDYHHILVSQDMIESSRVVEDPDLCPKSKRSLCEGCKQKVKKILQKIVGVYIIKMGAEMGKVTVSGDVESETLIRTLKLRSLKIALRKSSTLAKLPSPSQMKLAYTY